MAKTNENRATTYHYAQLCENRATVREQGSAINASLKALKRLSTPDSERRDDDTQQHITLPHAEVVNLKLRIALEKAKKERDKGTPSKGTVRPKKRRKRWFKWDD